MPTMPRVRIRPLCSRPIHTAFGPVGEAAPNTLADAPDSAWLDRQTTPLTAPANSHSRPNVLNSGHRAGSGLEAP